jgi:hypothetical protein
MPEIDLNSLKIPQIKNALQIRSETFPHGQDSFSLAADKALRGEEVYPVLVIPDFYNQVREISETSGD